MWDYRELVWGDSIDEGFSCEVGRRGVRSRGACWRLGCWNRISPLRIGGESMSTVGVENDAVDRESCRCEIERFVAVTSERSEWTGEKHRRRATRLQRSWPLVVDVEGLEGALSVALHEGNSAGVSFLSSVPLVAGGVVGIRLFWFDSASAFVPARVRHVTGVEHGYLVGCEFCLDGDRREDCGPVLAAAE
jgi:hypothetical protein